jgi:hypothetical protein
MHWQRQAPPLLGERHFAGKSPPRFADKLQSKPLRSGKKSSANSVPSVSLGGKTLPPRFTEVTEFRR